MTDRKPVEVFHPGKYLLDELEAKCCPVLGFAYVCGIGAHVIAEIIREERAIDKVIADVLSKALGMSANYWLDLQREWDEMENRRLS